MERKAIIMLVIFICISLSSCGGNSQVNSDDLIGVWNATKREFIDAADHSHTADVIEQGSTFKLTIYENGTYESVLTPNGGTPEIETGTWETSIDVLTITETGMPFSVQFEFELLGDILTLSGGDSEYDFDDTGHPIPTELDMILAKQS